MKNTLKIAPGLEDMGLALNPYIETYPDGFNANVMAVSLKSADPVGAENFILGVPNTCVVTNPGYDYFYKGSKKPNEHFPTIHIRGYAGTPIPVVDPGSGELVAVLTNFMSWDSKKPSVNVNVITDKNTNGISSEDTGFDIVLGGFFVENVGINYSPDTMVELRDKDTGLYNGDVEPIIVDGRIVGVEVINTGSGFKRIPEVIISGSRGRGAKLYPIMDVITRTDTNPKIEGVPKICSVHILFFNKQR